jgi:hypothetical protein
MFACENKLRCLLRRLLIQQHNSKDTSHIQNKDTSHFYEVLRTASLFFIDFSLMSSHSDPSASALTNPMLHLPKPNFRAAISCC